MFKAGRRQRSPLYDELSIPFIDASLPPTPKVGRSSNPLEILLGRIDGSRTSLNGETNIQTLLLLHIIPLSIFRYIQVWELGSSLVKKC